MTNKVVTDLLLGNFDDDLLIMSDDAYFQKVLETPTITKDLQTGAVYKISEIFPYGKDKITVVTEEYGEIPVQLRKEKEFLKLINCSIEQFMEALLDGSSEVQLPNHVMTVKYGSELEGTLMGAHIYSLKQELYSEIKNPEKVYMAHVLERNKGGFLVNVNGLYGFLPGSLAAANRILDFDLYLNTKIPVMVEDYLQDSDMFIFSNKKYIKNMIPVEIEKLTKTEKYKGVVTGTSKFGIFVEFNTILTGLIHTSEMDKEQIEEFKKSKWKAGDEIEFWIKEITNDNRIILTFVDQNIMNQKYESLASFDAQMEQTGQKPVYLGHIVSVKPNVVLVKIEDNIIGALADKDFKKFKSAPLKVSDELRVKIEKIDITKRRMTLNMVTS
jgi:predicted RNA-binding protein with RPS1 domain